MWKRFLEKYSPAFASENDSRETFADVWNMADELESLFHVKHTGQCPATH